MSQRRNWTREETIIALNLFCTIPFNECTARHPLIAKVAQCIGRSPAAMNMKIGNFGRLDPTLEAKGISGLTNGSAMDELVWKEFYGNFTALAEESEALLEQFGILPDRFDVASIPNGEEREVTRKQRVNQEFFRHMVLSSYNNQCCITGISNATLLEACHISDWSKDISNRMNPHNGIPLTPTLHQAYDNNLIAIDADYKVHVADSLLADEKAKPFANDFLASINGVKITLPQRFAPSQELLDTNYQNFRRLWA